MIQVTRTAWTAITILARATAQCVVNRDMCSRRGAQQRQGEQRSGNPGCLRGHLPQPTLLDVVGHTAQGLEDRDIVLVVRAPLSPKVREIARASSSMSMK